MEIVLLGTVFEIELIFLHKMRQHERGYQTAISNFKNSDLGGKVAVFSKIRVLQKRNIMCNRSNTETHSV